MDINIFLYIIFNILNSYLHTHTHTHTTTPTYIPTHTTNVQRVSARSRAGHIQHRHHHHICLSSLVVKLYGTHHYQGLDAQHAEALDGRVQTGHDVTGAVAFWEWVKLVVKRMEVYSMC